MDGVEQVVPAFMSAIVWIVVDAAHGMGIDETGHGDLVDCLLTGRIEGARYHGLASRASTFKRVDHDDVETILACIAAVKSGALLDRSRNPVSWRGSSEGPADEVGWRNAANRDRLRRVVGLQAFNDHSSSRRIRNDDVR